MQITIIASAATRAPVMSTSSSSGLTWVISLVFWSTSLWAITARVPQIIAASRCGAPAVFGPGAAHRLAVERDHDRVGIGEPGQHLAGQPGAERGGDGGGIQQPQYPPERGR